MQTTKTWLLRAGLLVVLAAAGMSTGCKQGEGEVCQIDNDCADGFCNRTTMTCRKPGSVDAVDAAGIESDARVDPVDASTVDADTTDGAFAIDASDTPDAS